MKFSGHTAKTTAVIDDGIVGSMSWVGGQKNPLNLNDVDFSTFVPKSVPSFGGDLMLVSPLQTEVVVISHPFQADQTVDAKYVFNAGGDAAFATTASGTMYAVDGANNDVVAITGQFTPGQAFTSGFNSVNTLDLVHNQTAAFSKDIKAPKGLLFVPGHADHNEQ